MTAGPWLHTTPFAAQRRRRARQNSSRLPDGLQHTKELAKAKRREARKRGKREVWKEKGSQARRYEGVVALW